MPKTEPSTAAELIPPNADLDTLRKSAADCQACDLWKLGTQTVFGEGTRRASLLFVGEQPGNEEDLSGRPFVGPAGRVLATALEEAGIPREKVYITNIVKHFAGSLAASDVFTRSQIPRRSLLASHGSRLKSM